MSQRELLPTSVRPLHYDLTLAPDLEKFVFTGSETVRVNVTEETDRVVVHAKELEIQSAECSPEGGAPVKASDISFNKEDETAVFTFPSKIPVGPASLRIAFMGTLNDKMAGFYRSQYTTSSGETRHMAVTQFEATDARRAFPCWDEPALKATFQTTLIVPSDRLALSNTMPEEEKQTEDGRTQIRFAKTPIMSTYLLAFVVGEFDHVEDKTKEGVLVRVFTPKGQAEKGRFALEVGVKCLSFYTEYFNIPYPLEKLDMVAIADFAAGAMENWGLVTYRSVLVMYDEATTPAHIKQRIAYVVAHELAHQWFGNLVTMEWWMHLWLNEGFATYIGWKATDVIFPDWSIWEQFTVGDQLQGLRLDALRTSHPIEVEIAKASQVDEIFDHISYCKGASVIRMLVNYLGEEDFRAGMQSYLKRHQFANAATEHLWAALSESSGKPVKDVMDSWTKQTGHPVVKASAHSDTELSVSQERYLASGPDALTDEDKTVLWQVPLRLADGDATVLTSRSAVVPRPDIPKINRGQTSFFRVAYDAPLIKAIGESFAALAPVDRVGVNNDAFALASAGYTSVTSALELLSHLRADDEYTVLSDAFGSIAEVLSVWYDADEAMLGHIRQFAIGIVQPVVERVGWEPRDGESHLIKMLRTEALSFAGKLGVPEVVAEARRRFANILSGNTSETPADLRSAVYATVVRHGGVQEVDQIIELFRKSNSSDQRVVMLTSSGASADPAAVEKALQWSLTDDVRSQDLFYVLGSASANGRGRESAWQFLQKNWNVLFERYGGGAFLLARVATISCETFASNERADEIEAFFATKSVPGIERPVSQAVEKVRARAAWRARDTDQLRAWLAQRFQS